VGVGSARQHLPKQGEFLSAKGKSRPSHKGEQTQINTGGVDVAGLLVADVDDATESLVRVQDETAAATKQGETAANTIGGVGVKLAQSAGDFGLGQLLRKG
jgi:hypothetical protein